MECVGHDGVGGAQDGGEQRGEVEVSLGSGPHDTGEYLLGVGAVAGAIAAADLSDDDGGANGLFGAPVGRVDRRVPQEGEHGRASPGVVRIGLTFVVPTANCRGFFNRPGGAGSRHRARTPSRSRRASSAALVEAGASEQTAETAAGDIGELSSEVRIIRWMLAMLLAVVISGFGLLGAATLQILPLLP